MALSGADIPTLDCGRLRLEPLSMAHSQGMYDLWSNEEVCAYSGVVSDRYGKTIPTPTGTRADSDRIIDFWLGASAEGWGCRWAVILVASNSAFAGMVGFNALSVCSEIAFHLLPRFWGRGIMTEASVAAIQWARKNGATQIEAFIDPANLRSIALGQRLGMAATDTYVEGAQRYFMFV